MSDLILKHISIIAMQNRQIITKLLWYDESNLIVDAEERKRKEAEEKSKESNSNTNNNTTKVAVPASTATPAVNCGAGKSGN